MIRIGLLGSDNSHALGFAKYINIAGTGSCIYDDVRITHIYGHDEAQTAKVAAEGSIPNAVRDPMDMIGGVDAVMVLFRDGKYHYPYALPFIRSGMPVWIDKPLAIKPQEARTLVSLAEEYNSPLSGGSCCKLIPDLFEIKQYIGGLQVPPLTAMLNFPVSLNSEYSGIHFYAPHLVEMATEVFGFKMRSVTAHRNGENLIVAAEYEKFSIVLAFMAQSVQYSCYIIEKNRTHKRDLDISEIIKLGMDDFIRTIKTGRPGRPPENLYKVTVIVDAIERSMNANKRVELEW